MARQNLAMLNENGPGFRVNAAHPAVIAGSAFAIGVVTGVFLKGLAEWTWTTARHLQWRREYERTVTYDHNLPDPLKRREPAPEAGQPRFGGTGALGVSPASAGLYGREPK